MKRLSACDTFSGGALVELTAMDDPYLDMPPGLKGTVLHVDDPSLSEGYMHIEVYRNQR